MKVQYQDNQGMGVVVYDFNHTTASDQDIEDVKQLIYEYKIVVIKEQDLSPDEYCDFGYRLGEVEKYYQPMYHHPEREEIFVSSNVAENGQQVGVPKTGKFWHADYAFMPSHLHFQWYILRFFLVRSVALTLSICLKYTRVCQMT